MRRSLPRMIAGYAVLAVVAAWIVSFLAVVFW